MAPDLPIIIMSGRISPGDASVRRLVEHYGAQAVLSKPFTSEELRNAVATVIT
jgi:CheY-like chemotaxis protein